VPHLAEKIIVTLLITAWAGSVYSDDAILAGGADPTIVSAKDASGDVAYMSFRRDEAFACRGPQT
jgi:hypothetical protein